MNAKVLMTTFGKDCLDQELEQLTKVTRAEIKNEIATARAHGDLKENAEYHAAKEKQSHAEGRIQELQSKIARCEVVDPSKTKSEKVVFGATVTLFDDAKDKSVIYQIVGEDEANIKNGKISYQSPLGKSLIGLEEGDTAIVKAPKGNIEYEVETINYK